MKYRPQRELLEESMKEVWEFSTRKEFFEYIWNWGEKNLMIRIYPEHVKVEPYGGFDARIGWDTHIVTVQGHAIGFTNGPLPS